MKAAHLATWWMALLAALALPRLVAARRDSVRLRAPSMAGDGEAGLSFQDRLQQPVDPSSADLDWHRSSLELSRGVEVIEDPEVPYDVELPASASGTIGTFMR